MSSSRWIGKTIGGRYQIEDLLGRGGMSAVYKAKDPNLSRTVAIKLIHPHLADESEFVDRFREEATVVAQMRHPNIVQVFDFNRDENDFYMVMEFVAGETLRDRLDRLNKTGGEIPLVKVMKYAINICEAADYAHRRDLIHRDIKPANVMLDLQDQAILMDFGIAKIIGGPQFTATGATVGTAMYMSPEQIRGERVDERSDIYAIGILLFEMLCGHPPFQADSPTALLMMHLGDPVPDLGRLRPDCPDDLITIVEKALAKDRENRYQHASEMGAALGKALAALQASLQAATTVDRAVAVDTTALPAAAPFPADDARTPAGPRQGETGRPETAPPAAVPPPPDYVPPEVVSGGKSRKGLLIAGCLLTLGAVVIIGGVLLALYLLNNSEDDDTPPVAEPAATTVTAELSEGEEVAPEEPVELPTPVEENTGAVTDLEELSEAVIQIEAQGSFVNPAVGLGTEYAGSGSGFIIDPSGIAVTNNHVVTGAALLRIWVGGDPEPVNARVLGVSECSDLAVIDLDGDGYRYLEWYDSPINPGLEVYAAGYPLGEPEFTLTKGIIAKERALGESVWSSVDAVVQHDAAINPGSSGGPLVTADGKVVAVNYRGSAELNYFLAITRDEASAVLERLQQGEDVTSIGINGVAVNDDGAISGIWVSSVASGSPADRAGIEGGDILTKMEGLAMGEDGTMSDYCDILRSHGPEDTLAVEVLRFNTQEALEGQINGEPLAPASAFAGADAGQVGGDLEEGATAYNNYWTVNDDTSSLFMQVPAEWSDVRGESVDIELLDGRAFLVIAVQASPNIDDAWNTYSTPGAFFSASEEFAAEYDAASLLDINPFREDYDRDCVYEGRFEIERELYSGLYDQYSNCGDASTIFALVAVPESGNYLAFLLIQAISDADFEAADQIWSTFYVAE